MQRLGGSVLMLMAAATPLFGQRSALREVRHDGFAGVTLVIAEPLGDFRRNGDVAVGLTAFGVVGLDGSGTLGLRIDGAYMVYDAAYRGYGVTTRSQIGTLAIGPQMTLGKGPLRPYGFATLGGSLFWSSASYDGYCGCYDSDVFYLDGHFTTATQVGTGVLIQVSRRRMPIAIDLGLRDMRHARVQYVPAGGFTEYSDGTYTAERVETPVHLRVFQAGVSIGVR